MVGVLPVRKKCPKAVDQLKKNFVNFNAENCQDNDQFPKLKIL